MSLAACPSRLIINHFRQVNPLAPGLKLLERQGQGTVFVKPRSISNLKGQNPCTELDNQTRQNLIYLNFVISIVSTGHTFPTIVYL